MSDPAGTERHPVTVDGEPFGFLRRRHSGAGTYAQHQFEAWLYDTGEYQDHRDGVLYVNTCASRADAMVDLAWRRSVGPVEDDLNPALGVVIDEEFNRYDPGIPDAQVDSFIDGTLEVYSVAILRAYAAPHPRRGQFYADTSTFTWGLTAPSGLEGIPGRRPSPWPHTPPISDPGVRFSPPVCAGQGRVHITATHTIISGELGWSPPPPHSGGDAPSASPPAPGVVMLRKLRRAMRPARLRLPARRFTAGIVVQPPTARDALGIDATAQEAIAYNRVRVATATAVALYRSGYTLPMPDGDLDDAVRALDFPYSVPSPETRASIRAALAVLEADYTVTVTH